MSGRFELMNENDRAMLDYIIPCPIKIKSTGEQLFSGEVWILVNGSSASAVEYAVMYAMATDFATIVGSPTRGVTGGGLPAFFVLPNTGLVIRYDYGYFIGPTGRAIDEFGITPDYLNLPGKNALETVLHMIKE
jgi:C-terminal processing protease CtpA/Prc